MIIKGTSSAIQAVAAIRDRDAGCPRPYSLLLAGKWRNVCPRCSTPIKPPWTCSKCGWRHANGVPKDARYQMGLRVADVVTDDAGEASTDVDESMIEKIRAAKGKPSAKRTKKRKGDGIRQVETKAIITHRGDS